MSASNSFPSRRLRRTDAAVTTLGYGGALIGGFRFALSEQQAAETISAALSSGIRYFDTSPYYGYGRSEHLLGSRYVACRVTVSCCRPSSAESSLRSAMTQSSMGTGLEGFRSIRRTIYSADGAYSSLEQSLMRIGMNRVDVVFIHDVEVWKHCSQAEADRRFAEAMADCFRH